MHNSSAASDLKVNALKSRWETGSFRKDAYFNQELNILFASYILFALRCSCSSCWSFFKNDENVTMSLFFKQWCTVCSFCQGHANWYQLNNFSLNTSHAAQKKDFELKREAKEKQCIICLSDQHVRMPVTNLTDCCLWGWRRRHPVLNLKTISVWKCLEWVPDTCEGFY